MLYLGIIALKNNGTIFSFAGLQVHELRVLNRFFGMLDFNELLDLYGLGSALPSLYFPTLETFF